MEQVSGHCITDDDDEDDDDDDDDEPTQQRYEFHPARYELKMNESMFTFWLMFFFFFIYLCFCPSDLRREKLDASEMARYQFYCLKEKLVAIFVLLAQHFSPKLSKSVYIIN